MNKNLQINKIVEHIKAEYGAEPEFLWPERYPGYAVFRHSAPPFCFCFRKTWEDGNQGYLETNV